MVVYRKGDDIMLIVYLIIIAAVSLITVIVFGIDKKISKKENAVRVPEIVLLSLISLGGAPGGLIGMYSFRHKTVFKEKFHFGIELWFSLILQIAAAIFIALIESKGIEFINL